MSDHESDSVQSNDRVEVPDGRPKSGRVWKKKQVYRSSAQNRQGVLSHLAKTKVEKDVERQKLKALKELEREMRDATKNKKIEARLKREEQEKRRQANEFKTAVYQTVSRHHKTYCARTTRAKHSLIFIFCLFCYFL